MTSNLLRGFAALTRLLVISSSGAAAIEGAIVLPIAISLMAGGIEFGRALSAYHTAEESMRSATRYLARVPRNSICSGQWGLDKARNLAVFGTTTPAQGAQPLISGWTTGTITLQKPTTCPSVAEPLVIQLQAAVPYTVILLSAIGYSNNLTFTVRHEERSIGE